VIPLPSWTHQDIGIKSNVAGPLYVTLQDSGARTATITHDDPNIALATSWSVWGIPLVRFTSLNPNLDLTNIQKITVGVGNKGTGTLYFDDIRLYTPMCISGLPGPAADFNGDCFVDYYDLDILTDNWLVSEYQVTPAAPSNANLEAYYQFENNLLDSSKGHNGSDPCGVITYAAGGQVGLGQAASLNGGYVLVGPVGISGAAARTVAGWAKASTMSMPTADWINVFGFTSRSGTLPNRSFDIEKWGYGNAYAIHVFGWEREILPVDLEWHHLAASYDGTTIRWYGDGQLFGEDSSRVLDTNDLVHMGKRADISAATTSPFQGFIDEVRIYGRVLSQAEVASLALKTAPFTQPLNPLLTPQNPAINDYYDGVIDFRDYAVLAGMWLEELLWPPPMMNVWGYEFKNDANCYDPGKAPKEARDLHLEFDGPVNLVDTGPFTTFTGNGSSKITLSGGTVPANGSTKIRVGNNSTTIPTLKKWWWTDALGQRIGKEMSGVGPSCKKIT